MSLDIRGVWKYQDLLKEYSELQVRASKVILEIQHERDEARRECGQLKERCDEQRKDLRALRLQCGALDNECKKLRIEKDWQRKERKAARAEAEQLKKEIEKLKKVKYRWVNGTWWPVEGTNIYDMIKKVPCVPYAMRVLAEEDKQVPEI